MRDKPPEGRSGREGRKGKGTREAATFTSAITTGQPSGEPEGLYRLLVESVRDYAIFALDPTGHVLSWNRGAQRIKGYTPEEIIGKHFSIFYPREDIERGKPAWELEIATRDGRLEDEGWRLRKDGTRFWANVVITALRDEHGTLVGFAKVTRDLTERRRAEEALRTSEERYRLLVTNVRDYAIYMLDPTGLIATWNEGAERIKGFTDDEVIGHDVSMFYPPEDVAADKPQRELEIAARDGRYETEGWRVRKDGTRFWAHSVITAMHNSAGELMGFTKVTRDLTERMAAQERAIAAARRVAEAEAANRAKSDFLAAMSHELRTPLNAIGGYAELIELGVRGPVTPEQKTDLERILRSQKHLLAIINDLLNFSRLEAGKVTYDIEPISIAQVIEATVPMIAPQARAKQIALEIGDCPPEAVARGDRSKVEQILVNVLSNAVKYTEAGGRVDTACTVEEERVLLTVRDTGVGIPPEKIEAIFEPFVQLGRTLTNVHEGTGLGLAISRDLARAMGGDLSVESTVGGGSTFTLALPKA